MNSKFESLGWVVAAALVGVMISSGFQGNTQKVGVVDVQKVFRTSDLFKKNQDAFRAVQTARQDTFQFASQYRVFTPPQAARFKELSLKPGITAAEKTELEKIKSEVMAADKEFKALQTKPSPTPEETKKLEDFNAREKTMRETLQRWGGEFEDELDKQEQQLSGATIDKIKSAVGDVGKAQGYTIIFSKDVVPYGANDVTEETLKVANKK